MELILKQDVKNLGYKDDIVKVKNGYGLNYLIPQGFAILATESAKKYMLKPLNNVLSKWKKSVKTRLLWLRN